MSDPEGSDTFLRSQHPHHWGGLGGFRYTLGSLNVPKGFRSASVVSFTGAPKRSRTPLVSVTTLTALSLFWSFLDDHVRIVPF